MKKNLVKAVIVLLIIVLVTFTSRYRFPSHYSSIRGFTQGTTYLVTYVNKEGVNLQPAVDSLLADFDTSLSTYIIESVISKVNYNESNVVLDSHFIAVFNKSFEVYKESDGAFDITVAPVVNAWGFGFTGKVQVDSNLIDSLVAFVGMDKIKIEKGKVVKKFPQTMLDVNAIAQGYSVDVVAEFLDHKGIKDYLVEIGGEVRTKGKNPKGRVWTIGIDKPLDNNLIPGSNLQAKLRLKDQSMATSGNYRKFFEEDGQKYVHSINPKTGYPVTSNLLSATVISDDCMTADAWATAFMVMGLDKTKEFLNKKINLQAYLIYSDEEGNLKTYATKGVDKLLKKR
ncbi:MAG: FAD:protein FMN transferase [Bacteroidales bacterium]|nr:FAD:protein FMN transferase [Bacteroidales bacterium]